MTYQTKEELKDEGFHRCSCGEWVKENHADCKAKADRYNANILDPNQTED